MAILRHRRGNNIVSALLLAALGSTTAVLLVLPNEYAGWLVGVWTVLSVMGCTACAFAIRIRWKQRAAVVNPHRHLPAQRRKALKSIANANVRREIVRGLEFVLFLILGVAIISGISTPFVGRGVIVLLQSFLLANILYDLIEMAYTEQFLEAAAKAAEIP